MYTARGPDERRDVRRREVERERERVRRERQYPGIRLPLRVAVFTQLRPWRKQDFFVVLAAGILYYKLGFIFSIAAATTPSASTATADRLTLKKIAIDRTRRSRSKVIGSRRSLRRCLARCHIDRTTRRSTGCHIDRTTRWSAGCHIDRTCRGSTSYINVSYWGRTRTRTRAWSTRHFTRSGTRTWARGGLATVSCTDTNFAFDPGVTSFADTLSTCCFLDSHLYILTQLYFDHSWE